MTLARRILLKNTEILDSRKLECKGFWGLKHAVTEEENEVEISEPRDLPAHVRLTTKRHHQAA